MKTVPLQQVLPCEVCRAPGALICPTRQGQVVVCLGCTRDLGRLWTAQKGGG